MKELKGLQKDLDADNKMGLLEKFIVWIKWSLHMIYKKLEMYVLIIGAVVIYWVFHTKGVGNKEAGMINWSSMLKSISLYGIRTFLNASIVLLGMVVITLLNKDKWKEHIKNVEDSKNT